MTSVLYSRDRYSFSNMSIKTVTMNPILLVALSLFFAITLAPSALAEECGGATTTILKCDKKDPIIDLAKNVIFILTGGIGVVAVGAIIYGAILYSSSGATPDSMKKAKDMWLNIAIGLALFAFMVVIINFLIPGGVFGGDD